MLPWLLSAGIMLLGIPLCLAVRPDPRRVAEILAGGRADDLPAEPAPLREILRRPGVLVAMGGALTSFAVMVAVMNLTGYVVVSVHGHAQSSAFPIISRTSSGCTRSSSSSAASWTRPAGGRRSSAGSC